jgi:hypothetical protein
MPVHVRQHAAAQPLALLFGSGLLSERQLCMQPLVLCALEGCRVSGGVLQAPGCCYVFVDARTSLPFHPCQAGKHLTSIGPTWHSPASGKWLC